MNLQLERSYQIYSFRRALA